MWRRPSAEPHERRGETLVGSTARLKNFHQELREITAIKHRDFPRLIHNHNTYFGLLSISLSWAHIRDAVTGKAWMEHVGTAVGGWSLTLTHSPPGPLLWDMAMLRHKQMSCLTHLLRAVPSTSISVLNCWLQGRRSASNRGLGHTRQEIVTIYLLLFKSHARTQWWIHDVNSLNKCAFV